MIALGAYPRPTRNSSAFLFVPEERYAVKHKVRIWFAVYGHSREAGRLARTSMLSATDIRSPLPLCTRTPWRSHAGNTIRSPARAVNSNWLDCGFPSAPSARNDGTCIVFIGKRGSSR